MKAVFLCLNYPPEIDSSTFLFQDTLSASTSVGFETIVFLPNPVRGLSKDEIRKYSATSRNVISNALFIRIHCFSFAEKNLFFRLLRIVSFIQKASHQIQKMNDIAFVYVPSNPPVIWSLIIERLARKKHFKVLCNINDIYPEVYFRKGTLIYSLLEKGNRRSLRNCQMILTLSADMKNSLIKKGASPEKIHVVSPWSYSATPLIPSEKERLIRECNFDSSFFNVTYLGNVGKFQNIPYLIEVAKLLTGSPIRLHIIGGGRLYDQALKSGCGLSNLFFHSKVSPDEAVFLYSLSDVNVISLNPGVIFYACPSKTPLCVESGKPLIVAVDPSSLYAEEIKRKSNAIVVSPTDPMEFVNACLLLSKGGKTSIAEVDRSKSQQIAISSLKSLFLELANS